MKKKTIKQLEEELKCFDVFVETCSEWLEPDNYRMKYYSREIGEDISCEDVLSMPLDKRYEIASELANNNSFEEVSIHGHGDAYKATRILYILGFKDLALFVNKRMIEYIISEQFRDKAENIKHQIKQKQINSKGGKGRTSKHKDEALKIASDTWTVIPNASMESLSRKIHEYLNKKYRGLPEPGTMKTWLKESGLNPEQSPKTKDYDLVIK